MSCIEKTNSGSREPPIVQDWHSCHSRGTTDSGTEHQADATCSSDDSSLPHTQSSPEYHRADGPRTSSRNRATTNRHRHAVVTAPHLAVAPILIAVITQSSAPPSPPSRSSRSRAHHHRGHHAAERGHHAVGRTAIAVITQHAAERSPSCQHVHFTQHAVERSTSTGIAQSSPAQSRSSRSSRAWHNHCHRAVEPGTVTVIAQSSRAQHNYVIKETSSTARSLSSAVAAQHSQCYRADGATTRLYANVMK
jgi:hypothetical protein